MEAFKVRQDSSAAQSATYAQLRAGNSAHSDVVGGNRHGMLRGFIHGIVLSLAIWLAAGYLTFILR